MQDSISTRSENDYKYICLCDLCLKKVDEAECFECTSDEHHFHIECYIRALPKNKSLSKEMNHFGCLCCNKAITDGFDYEKALHCTLKDKKMWAFYVIEKFVFTIAILQEYKIDKDLTKVFKILGVLDNKKSRDIFCDSYLSLQQKTYKNLDDLFDYRKNINFDSYTQVWQACLKVIDK